MWRIKVEYMDGEERCFFRDSVMQNGCELKLANLNINFDPKTESMIRMYKDAIYIPFLVIRFYTADYENINE